MIKRNINEKLRNKDLFGYGLTQENFTTSNKNRLENELNNVDNTRDIDKPISIDTQNALDNKVDILDYENGIISLGSYNATTNTPTLTSTPDTSILDGSIYNVTVKGASAFSGSNFITGTILNAGDIIKKVGSHWIRIPFEIPDKSISVEKTTFIEDVERDNSLFILTVKDIDGRDRIIGKYNINYKWVLDILLSDNSVIESSITNGSVSIDKLNSTLKTFIQMLSFIEEVDTNFDDSSIFRFVAGNKILADFKKNGYLKALFDFSLKKITQSDLDDNLNFILPSSYDFDPNFDKYIGKLVTKNSKGETVVICGVKQDGSIDALVNISNGSISYDKLDDSLKLKLPNQQFIKQNSQNSLDCEYYDDGMWRTKEVEINVRTSHFGIDFINFPPLKTNQIKIINTTGVVLEIIKPSIDIRGRNFIGQIDFTTSTINGAVQKYGDWWEVTGEGTLDGVTFNIGDRVYYLGRQSNSGTYTYKFCKDVQGEYYLKGEILTSSIIDNQKNYDCWICNESGNYKGMIANKGDLLVYESNLFYLISTDRIELDNNKIIILNCNNSREYAIRRLDKSTTKLNILAKGKVYNAIRKINNDLVGISDSMFGVNIGSSISTLLLPQGRIWTTESFGGATSEEVLTMIQKRIRTTDIHKGKLHVLFHGQNNQSDETQIKEVTQRMVDLISVFESKYIVWSMVGQIITSFNGTRIVCTNHETAYLDPYNSRFVRIENHYDNIYYGKHFSPRKALLLSAIGRTRKHLQFPSLTEEQVASTYGIPPFSYFFKYETVTWNPDNLNFIDYWNAISLPTSDIGNNLDYYIRTGNGIVGQIIVKVNDSWIEYTHDVTHVSKEGGDAIANQFVNTYLNLKNY